MKYPKHNATTLLTSFVATLLICLPAWADDTEIYFGGSSTPTVQPNVLFVLDTSSSMNETDGGSTTRLARMKEALTNILNTAQDINVGLMRFSNPGGAILYPVKDIDAAIASSQDDTITLTGSVDRQIETAEDDVEEPSTNIMSLNSTAIEMSTVPTIESGSVDVQINYYKATAEEEVSTGDVNRTSSDLELMHEGGSTEQIVGLRFQNVTVPQGATISSAWIEFEVDRKQTGDLAVRIYGEDTDDADYYHSSSDDDISDRTKTTNSVVWNITAEPSPNQSLNSADISTLVKEIVDRSGWAENNHMAFMLHHESGDSGNYRELESGDEESSASPILHIRYSAVSTTAGVQTSGYRFNEINIPQGATITSANMTFTASGDTSNSTSLRIYAEDADHSEVFTTTDNDLTNRSRTTNYGSWLSMAAWTDGNTYTSPDLTSVVQEVVDRTGWCGGHSLGFVVTGTGTRAAKAYESNPTLAAQLNITYDVPSSPGCFNREYSKIISQSSDDAEQYANGTMDLDSTDLELVVDDDNSSGNQTIGLRFNDISLTQGSELTHAYLEFAVDEVEASATTALTIKAENTDNSATFTTAANNITGRSTTSASVSWNIDTQWSTEHSIKRSPNIASLLNEVLARSGWSPGNAISLIISGTGERVVEAYDGSTLAPRLVYYAADSEVATGSHTVRQELIQLVDEIEYKDGTPIVDSLYEAALYYRGDTVDYGKVRGTGADSDQAKARVSHPSSYTGGTLVQPTGCTDDDLGSTACADEEITGSPTYTSPITESCQANHIVLLTDGEASVNTAADKVKTLTGDSSCADSGDEACGIELASFLKNVDQIADTSLTDDQTITTHTIGFNFSSSWLASLASTDAGGGGYHEADSATELTSVFDTKFKSILAVNSTFVEPSVTINQFNRFAHRDDVYFALFKPQETAKWYGNLKKYQLKGSPATLYDDHNPQEVAIDPSTGFFALDSQSFWSADEDGNAVEKGGAASRIPSTRKVFTNVASSAVLSVTDNAVSESNTLITKELLDIVGETDSYQSEVIQWARGLDENDANRLQIGDTLHSRPELITYDGVSSTIESTIFFGTNEGFLHAIDINTGIEQFAFIPQELLANLNTYYVNASVNPRPYGLDGGLTVWTKDLNNDGDLKDTGDFAKLYVGMRRGGRNYYALDVTDVSNPELMWEIEGGSGDFASLGQTWSEPVKTKVNISDTIHDVLIFAGGYDPDQDDATVRTADDIGNAIYIVDADTGARLWSGGVSGQGHSQNFSAMDYSIPSDITVLDMNRDGIADQMYVGDMGGQVWRFDIDGSGVNASSLVSGGIVADLAVDSDTSAARRFYYKPDLALAVDGKHRYLSLAIGSGYRAHPLNTAIVDRFYMIKVLDTHDAPGSYTTIDETDLYDATDNLLVEGTDDEIADAQEALSNDESVSNRKKGWFIRMENSGEKVLSSSATIQNQIVFTTYEPTPPATGSCDPKQGTSRAYLVSIFNAEPMLDITEDGNTNKSDRVIQLQIGSIPSTPTVIDTIDSKPTVWVGPERLDQVSTDVESIRTYWIEESSH